MARADTRTRILAAARDLMLKRGYAATPVDEICSAAGVSKGSLYHFFASKEEVGLAVLNAFYREGMARVGTGDYLRIADPYGRLMGFFDHLEATAPEFWRHGCLMGNFATELAESSPIIHARVAELLHELVAGVTPLFRAVADDPAEATGLAEQLLMVLEGAIILARAHDDPAWISAGARRFRRTIEARAAGAGAVEPS